MKPEHATVTSVKFFDRLVEVCSKCGIVSGIEVQVVPDYGATVYVPIVRSVHRAGSPAFEMLIVSPGA